MWGSSFCRWYWSRRQSFVHFVMCLRKNLKWDDDGDDNGGGKRIRNDDDDASQNRLQRFPSWWLWYLLMVSLFLLHHFLLHSLSLLVLGFEFPDVSASRVSGTFDSNDEIFFTAFLCLPWEFFHWIFLLVSGQPTDVKRWWKEMQAGNCTVSVMKRNSLALRETI